MRIAIVGWGSLLWDLETLAPNVAGGWERAGGPRLPLEFSRVSPKRRGALAVVTDAQAGVPCMTSVIASRRSSVGDALIDLADRERAPRERIGAVSRDATVAVGSHPDLVRTVAEWLTETGWDGAVWTDLPANFAETTGAAFSVETGARYLRSLAGESAAEAVRYIESAPEETDTPLRRALAQENWWRDAAEALSRG